MTDRRDLDIAGFDERARFVGELVAQLLVLEATFEDDGDAAAATETRGFAALLRDRGSGYADRSRRLRADRDPVTQPLLAVRATTRRRAG